MQPVGSASLQPAGSGTQTPPPQSAVHPHSPVLASHAQPEGKQPSSWLQICPAGHPLLRHPLGSGLWHSPPGTQTPPPQSSVQTQEPLASSQEHDDDTQPREVSQMDLSGQPLTTHPAGFPPAQELVLQLQVSQPSGPLAKPFSQYNVQLTGSQPPGGGAHAQSWQPSAPVWNPCSHAMRQVTGSQSEAPSTSLEQAAAKTTSATDARAANRSSMPSLSCGRPTSTSRPPSGCPGRRPSYCRSTVNVYGAVEPVGFHTAMKYVPDPFEVFWMSCGDALAMA